MPLTYAMAALSVCCFMLGRIGLHRQVTSSDPAGNGMATGFVQGFAEAGLEFTAILAGLYLLCRWRPIRYVCVAILALLSVVMVLLVR
ncbi:MAG: hypothetical protein EOO77_40625 [Oxalobacteraceae bacterium]|nr:MAG: hypothetical protein EOO77_40625 [Oxalobacteraceae bacterium]